MLWIIGANIETTGKTAGYWILAMLGCHRILSMRGVDATVTIAHSKTEGMEQQCQQADIIVAAVGKPNMVKKLGKTWCNCR